MKEKEGFGWGKYFWFRKIKGPEAEEVKKGREASMPGPQIGKVIQDSVL